MIVVTTPTGKIGSQVIPQLLSANEAVRVVVRNPAKIAPEIRDRVEIVTGSMDSETTMTIALEGAESVFIVVPPSFKDNNDTAYHLRFTRPTLGAIKRNGTNRIVGVSVLGRGTELAKKAGPITASLCKDEEIEKSGVDYRALWCPYLMDNMLDNVQTLRQQGMLFSPSQPDLKMPRVATKDVGAVGAKVLMDRSWTGQGGSAVLGPEDLSYNDMGAILSDVLGKSIRFQQVPSGAFRAQLMEHGANEIFAEGIIDMLVAKDKGMDNVEKRTGENTTPTSFRQWCEEKLKTAVIS